MVIHSLNEEDVDKSLFGSTADSYFNMRRRLRQPLCLISEVCASEEFLFEIGEGESSSKDNTSNSLALKTCCMALSSTQLDLGSPYA